jgi:tRNA G37 N-methylase TrmD
MKLVETLTKRPELLESVQLNKEQKKMLREIVWELRNTN